MVKRMMLCRKIHSLLMDGCPAALFLAAECFFHDLTSSDVVRSHAPTAEDGEREGEEDFCDQIRTSSCLAGFVRADTRAP